MEIDTTIREACTICKRLLFLVLVFLVSPLTGATSYLTMTDGSLLVFPDSCVQSMTQDGDVLTFIAIDGVSYSYDLADIVSVEEQLAKELPTITSYKFNNKYNYQVFADAVGIINGDVIDVEVAGIGKRLTATFSLSDDNAQAVVDGVEQISKETRIRFDMPKVYTVGYKGDQILKQLESGECAMAPFGRDYLVNVDFLTDHSTSVPRIDINTLGGVNITSKIEYVDAEIIIDGAGVFPSMTDSVQIRGRGNDSWSSDPNSKNPYRLKFASKVKPFGMTKGKNWVLLANKRRGSLLTNAFGMKAASLMGAEAANHIIPVDLYINGVYKGSYNFTEKVGLAGNSVDLDDESAAALLELDTYYDELATQKFRSAQYSTPVNIKSPDFNEDETLLTLLMIKNRYNSFETALANGGDIAEHVDIEALTRFLMINEYICNGEIFHPKSTFLYHENILDDSCKFIFGPVWDLDWAFGYNGSTAASYFNNSIESNFYGSGLPLKVFWNILHNDLRVKRRTWDLWTEFMTNGLDELCEFCQDYYNYAKPSITNNLNAGLDGFVYSNQIPQAISWFRQRADFIMGVIEEELFVAGDVNGDLIVSLDDLTALINFLLTENYSSISKTGADVNNDSEVNMDDLTALVNILLSQN